MLGLGDDDAGLLEDDGCDDGGPAVAAPDGAVLHEAVPLQQRQQSVSSVSVSFGMITERSRQDIAAMREQLLTILAEQLQSGVALETKHAVNFFSNVERKPNNPQQQKGHCMACGKAVTSTGSNRLVAHLTQCPLVPTDVCKEFQNLRDASYSKAAGKRQAERLASEEAEMCVKKLAKEHAGLKQTGIKASMLGAEMAYADRCIAEFFYANAIPFSVANTDAAGLYRRMVAAIKASPPGYKPPNYQKLGGELLDTCYDGMWAALKARDPEGAMARKYGATYVTDGWDSCDNLSLINSAFISNNDGGVFWRSVDTSGKVKNAEYTAALMIADIYSYGPTKVVLVVTDTCAVMQSAWEIVGYEFPWISCLPCQPHVISLLLKDIGKTAEVSSAMHAPSQSARRSSPISRQSQSCTEP